MVRYWWRLVQQWCSFDGSAVVLRKILAHYLRSSSGERSSWHRCFRLRFVYPFPVFFGDKKFVGLVHRTLTFAFLTWSTALLPFVWSTVYLQCVWEAFMNSLWIFAEIFLCVKTQLGFEKKLFCIVIVWRQFKWTFLLSIFVVLKHYKYANILKSFGWVLLIFQKKYFNRLCEVWKIALCIWF